MSRERSSLEGMAMRTARIAAGIHSRPGERRFAFRSAAVPAAFFILAVLCAGALSSCGSNSSSAPSSATAIAFTQVPPSPFPIGGQAQLIATVANDPLNMGVNWSVSCESSKCGAFSPAHTLSGGVTFYTAPNAVPNGNTVNITATSAYDPSVHVTVTIVLTVSTQTVGITFTQLPVNPIQINQTTMVTAVVTNDPTNAGVMWQLSCAGGSFCGSLSAMDTASGQPVTYTAPSQPPGNGGLVNIIAIANADPTVMVTAQTTVATNQLGISFDPQPPTTLGTGMSTPLTAVVVNDPNNLGVDWSVSCDISDCGFFDPPSMHTDSGMPITYTAPSTVPTNGIVTITAATTADPNTFVTANITITNGNTLGLLNGQYAFSLSGINQNSFFAGSGSITADGMGGISSGEEDFADESLQLPINFSLSGGGYTIDANGHGLLYLFNSDAVGASCQAYNPNPCPSPFQNGFVQIISFTVVNSSHDLIIQLDYSSAAHGRLDLQTPGDFSFASITGAYSFLFPGVNVNFQPAIVGGVFTANGAGGALSGTEDVNSNGTVTLGSLGNFTGSYNLSPIDGNGRGVACVPTDCSQYTFAYYIVNSGQLNFLETDLNAFFFLNSGPAYAQGTGIGNGSLKGSYGFTAAGYTGTKRRAVGGLLDSSGSGSITSGTIDVNDGGTPTLNTPWTGTYSISTNGRGSMTLSGAPNSIKGFQIYVTQSNGVLMLESDKSSLSGGAALAQEAGVTAATFSGNYGFYYESHPAATTQTNVNGWVTADGVSALTGMADANFDFPASNAMQNTGWTVAGSYGSGSGGRFTGDVDLTLTGQNPIDASEVFYVLNNSSVLMMESDAAAVGTGLFELQDLTVPQAKKDSVW